MAEEKKQNLFVRIIKGIFKAIGTVFKGIYYFFYSIRYAFYITGITIGASVFGFCLVCLVDTLIKIILPVSLDTGFIETFILAIIFVVLQVYIFDRKLNSNLTYNWIKPLILSFIPIILNIGLCFLLNLEDFTKESWELLFSGEIYPPEAFDEIFIILLPFFGPHLWLGCLTGEFWISTMICTFINCSVAWGICLVKGIRLEKFTNDNLTRMDEEKEKNKKLSDPYEL